MLWGAMGVKASRKYVDEINHRWSVKLTLNVMQKIKFKKPGPT